MSLDGFFQNYKLSQYVSNEFELRMFQICERRNNKGGFEKFN